MAETESLPTSPPRNCHDIKGKSLRKRAETLFSVGELMNATLIPIKEPFTHLFIYLFRCLIHGRDKLLPYSIAIRAKTIFHLIDTNRSE